MNTVGGEISEILALAGLRDLSRARLHGQLSGGARPAQHPPLGQHHLDVGRRSAERRWLALRREATPTLRTTGRAEATPPLLAPRPEAARLEDRVRPRTQGGVHLAAQLVAHAQVDGDGGRDHGQRHSQAGRAGNARAQCHRSLSRST